MMRRILQIAVGLVPVLMVNAAVWAQNAPPAPALRREQPVWVGFFVMFILTALIVFVSLLPSKRGHQD